MISNALLFKNANYQQINNILNEKDEQNYYLCASRKGFIKAICVENEC